MMRRFAGTGLLTLWIIQHTLVLLTIHLQISQCKETRLEAIRGFHPELQLVRMRYGKKEEIPWHETGRELLIGNILYDVVALNTTRDSLVILCYPDSEETHARNTIANLLKSDIQQNGNHLLLKKLSPFYPETLLISSRASTIDIRMPVSASQPFCVDAGDIATPPPRPMLPASTAG